MPPQGVLEIRQGRERPLAGPALGVHQAVEHLESVVAHAQRVGVGEGQADGPPHGPVILPHAVQLTTDVLARGLDPGQDPRNDEVFQFLVQHGFPTFEAVDDRPDPRGVLPTGSRVDLRDPVFGRSRRPGISPAS